VEIITHSDDIRGIGPKRQWIYDKFGDVFMVDDDVSSFVRTYLPKYRSRVKYSRMNADEATDLVNALYHTATEFGAFLFGVAIAADCRNYIAQKPFRLTGAINGGAFGMRKGSKLFFHPESVSANDTFVSGLNAYHHRYSFIDTRFGFVQKGTFSLPGGLSGMRSHGTEVTDREFLQRMFGKAIKWRRGNRQRLGPAKSPGNRTLKIPY
jgi:hypothetical protein